MKLKLEYQYFEGCPNHIAMKNNLNTALTGLENKVDLHYLLVDDYETASKINFRGSPTLLINGEDLLEMPAPEKPSLSCRYYQNGIPTPMAIKNVIIQNLNKGK